MLKPFTEPHDLRMIKIISICLLCFLSIYFPLAAQAQATVEYIHTDALGSPVAVTDASGNVIEREIYEPYGSPITRPPSDQPGFTGHVADSLTNLTYMQQRYYDPQIGRFLSVDPVTAYSNPVGAFNRYWYANNNPYKFTDPDGRAVETVWDVANVAMGVASFGKNVAIGNYVGATIDAVGVVVDGAATAVPFVPGGAGAAIKATRGAGAILEANKAAGKAGEAATLVNRGGEIGGKQVTFKTSDGTTTRIDFTRLDRSGVIETKTGNARLSRGQQKLKDDIEAGRAVTPVGKNADAAGFTPGEPVRFKSFEEYRPDGR